MGPTPLAAPLSFRERLSLTARRNRLATVGAAILVLTLLLTFVVPLVYPVDPLDVDPENALAPPSAAHPLGTDDVGRDILARLADAGRLDLLIAFAVTGLALGAGALLGAAAGYAGGLLDDVVMRTVDVLLSFPAFILALADHGHARQQGRLCDRRAGGRLHAVLRPADAR